MSSFVIVFVHDTNDHGKKRPSLFTNIWIMEQEISGSLSSNNRCIPSAGLSGKENLINKVRRTTLRSGTVFEKPQTVSVIA
jgi:hypothetical protein